MSEEFETAPRGEAQMLEAIMEVLVGIASKDFSKRASLTGDGSMLDGIAAGLNMLAEEVGLQYAREQELQRGLIRAERLAAIGQLAAGVAHEINNPAAFVLGNLRVVDEHARTLTDAFARLRALAAKGDAAAIQALLDTLQPEALLTDVHDIVSENTAGMERIVRIVRQLKGFAHIEQDVVEEVNLNDVVLEACKVMRKQIDYRARLTQRLGDLPRLHGDRGRLVQVVTNLLANAVQALQEGAVEHNEIEVTTQVEGEQVVVAVRDTGAGIPPDVQARIFEPFFSTKGPGPGSTGLGLSSVYGTVRQSGGAITVDSAPGQGTEFRLYFPVTREQAGPRPRSPAQGDSHAPDRTLLLVEDEHSVRKLAAHVLGMYGYKVVEAKDGAEALAFLEAYPDAVHLVLTDVVMPNLGGLELSKRVQALRPDLPIVFMSGYTEEAVLPHGLQDKANFLQKPFTIPSLLGRVREAFAASRTA
jgi:signal transduction histidine kinase/CheY-like chemotaxis protein